MESFETELIIEGGGFPPMSARGCHQTLTVVPQGVLRRTVNGDLCYVGNHVTKYHSIIRCEDKTTLVNEGVIGRGQILRIGCLQRLWQSLNHQTATLERDPVQDSIRVIDRHQQLLSYQLKSSRTLTVTEKDDDQKIYVSYRPWLHMRVHHLKLFTDEWGLKTGWLLEAEEV